MHSPSAQNKQQAPAEAIRVVLVDDEPITWLGMRSFLDRPQAVAPCAGDFDLVGAVESARDARDLVAERHPHLAVVNVSLAGGGAFELLSEWSAHAAISPRAVIYSAREDSEIVRRALRAGAHGYVSKREPLEELLRAMELAAAGARHLSPRIEQGLLGDIARGAMLANPEEKLSAREWQVFQLHGDGKTARAIGETLHVSRKTVETHLQRIREKLGARDGRELQRRALLGG
jgi:two-component system invasion response regulator UvrY